MNVVRMRMEEPNCVSCGRRACIDDGFVRTGDGNTLCHECFFRIGNELAGIPLLEAPADQLIAKP